jgi:ring-1,2-phenylacetyl-CoA epoxidase subunit PaaD
MINKESQIREILESVTDPEIPVLTIADLGIIREINLVNDQIEVCITPTYSGCPAMDMIEVQIKAALQESGFDNVKVTSVLQPAWTTDWMTEEGKAKLKAYGIAPPVGSADKLSITGEPRILDCPLCGSENTQLVSQFGSTPCKALYKCNDCLEPFDYFKCH